MCALVCWCASVCERKSSEWRTKKWSECVASTLWMRLCVCALKYYAAGIREISISTFVCKRRIQSRFSNRRAKSSFRHRNCTALFFSHRLHLPTKRKTNRSYIYIHTNLSRDPLYTKYLSEKKKNRLKSRNPRKETTNFKKNCRHLVGECWFGDCYWIFYYWKTVLLLNEKLLRVASFTWKFGANNFTWTKQIHEFKKVRV